ncbi:MAG: S8 family serine peptidase [Rickettsiales bacterium]|nr:S8 family serine peptidase [Rickettsiales bacterium]
MSNILTALICTTVCATTSFAESYDCSDSVYRKYNASECATFSDSSDSSGYTALSLLGGALVAGAGIALVASAVQADDAGGNGKFYNQPTMRVYDTVGYTDRNVLGAILSDPNYKRNLEHYNEIRLAYSLARGFTGKGATIAVLDTGNYSWHGTAVANVVGTAIAPDAAITPYQVVDNAGAFLSYAEIGQIVSSATDARIFNSSWGISTTESKISAYNIKNKAQMVQLTGEGFINSIVAAARDQDAIFVWSAGNDGTAQSGALTALPRVAGELDGHFVNVVAWDTDAGALAWYSNQCGVTKNYCITAPGSGIDVGTRHEESGTSFAAPMVSGAIAVILEAFPYMTAAQVTRLLFTTARDLGAAGVDDVYGWGMLDLERATRPVGDPMVPLADEMRPLRQTRASGIVARSLKSANLNFTFFDAFGRAFDAKLNDSITFETRGRGFDRLRGNEPTTAVRAGNFEFGFSNENLLIADGFLETDGNNLTSFVGLGNEFAIGGVQFFQNARFGVSAPKASQDSFVSDFSGIYSASAKFGAQWRDWTAFVAMPMAVIAGEMKLHLSAGRDASGAVRFADASVDLAERPALEYSVSYKFLTASFIDNPPHDRDEFFIMAKTKLVF